MRSSAMRTMTLRGPSGSESRAHHSCRKALERKAPKLEMMECNDPRNRRAKYVPANQSSRDKGCDECHWTRHAAANPRYAREQAAVLTNIRFIAKFPQSHARQFSDRYRTSIRKSSFRRELSMPRSPGCRIAYLL